MKYTFAIFTALSILMTIGMQSLLASCKSPVNVERAESEYYLESNEPEGGMFFSSAYVVEEYEYDDAYCLLYNDADANMFNVEIWVDLETYAKVSKAIRDGRELIGALRVNEEESFGNVKVFTVVPDPEFEMAEACSKI